MKLRKRVLLVTLFFSVGLWIGDHFVSGQNINSYQPIQPGRSNYMARAVPAPTATPAPTSTPTPIPVPLFDAASTSKMLTVSGAYSWSHTVGSGSDRVLYASFVYFDVSSGAFIDGPPTFNGDAMTSIVYQTYGIGSILEVYRLINPDVGTHSINAIFDGEADLVTGGVSFKNINQTIPEGAEVCATATSTAPSATVVGVDTTNIILGILGVEGVATNVSMTTGAGQTQRFADSLTSSFRTQSAGNTEQSVVGNVVMSWTLSGSKPWADCAFEVKNTNLTAPTSLVATVVSSTQIHLAWNDGNGNEDGFEVYMDGDFHGTASFGSSLTYEATDLTPGTSYTFKVRAHRGDPIEYGPFSNEDTESTLP